MNIEAIEKIANAVLYEGYLLYPYRPDSLKNRRRWNFGTLYPPAYCIAVVGAEPASFHSQFLLKGEQDTALEACLRFLQFGRAPERPQLTRDTSAWGQAAERTVVTRVLLLRELCKEPAEITFHMEGASFEPESRRGLRGVSGMLRLRAEAIEEEAFRISLDVANTSQYSGTGEREEALLQALVSAHVIVQAQEGRMISLLDPPSELAQATSGCHNQGVFPVLAGDPRQPNTMLISPVILYDYPQIAAESSGDFFDATEIDEMLTLRVLTMTDEEKEQMSKSDPHARRILERVSGIGKDDVMKIHGAVRSLKRGGERS